MLKTDHETFQNRIAPAIPGLSTMSDLEAFRAIGEFCYRFCNLATTEADLITPRGGASDLDVNMDKFSKNEGGVWCGGAAHMCAQMLNASGRVDKAWYYADGIPQLTHSTTLASIGGVLFWFDPYLNGEYVDAQGETMPYLNVLRAIGSRNLPRWQQHCTEKNIHATSLANFMEWNAGLTDPGLYRLKRDAPDSQRGVGRGIVTAKTFRENYFEKDLVDRALIDLGYPAEPDDELWHYLRLHPITVENSDYGDTDNTKAKVFKSIRAAVSKPKPRNKRRPHRLKKSTVQQNKQISN